MIKNVVHTRICGGRDVVCHWPLQAGIWYWGDDEILLGHIHAPCAYRHRDEVAHGQHGMFSRAVVRLQRSRDLGVTWPEEENQALWDYTHSVEEQRARLHLDEYQRSEPPERTPVDMTHPDAILAFGRAFVGVERVGEDGRVYRDEVIWGFRSPDRGRTWEKVPSVVFPNHTAVVIEIGNGYLKRKGGELLGWFVGAGSCDDLKQEDYTIHPQLYCSSDHGETWWYVSDIWRDYNNQVACSYPRVLQLADGRLLCTLGQWMHPNATIRWASVTYSEDGGLTWSPARRINRWATSPYPIPLRDGRIVLVYARRCPGPAGILCQVSEDRGETWSEEMWLRDDAPWYGRTTDLGYPVGVQLRDGRIFVAYYYQLEEGDVPWPGGRKFIAGTLFELE